MSEKSIAIVGAGPIGGILGAYLASAGEKVVFVDVLEEHLEAIRTKGLVVTGFKELEVVVPDALSTLERLADFELDYVFLALKAIPTQKILPHLARILGPDVVVVSYQNGLHAEDQVAEVFGPDRTVRAVLNFAGFYRGPGRVEFTFFQKANYLGGRNDAAQAKALVLSERLSASGMAHEAVDDIVKHDWEKVILNVILGPICAIVGKTMKDTLACEGVPELSDGLLRECIDVAQAEGITWKPGFFESCQGFIRKAGAHKPSMLVDVEAGRQTEIDLICGKMVELGKKHGIETPCNATITTLVKAIAP